MNIDTEKVAVFLRPFVNLKEYAASRLAKHFGCGSKLLFYKHLNGELLEEGATKTGESFLFHGYGCSVKNDKEEWSVDLEFGPKGIVSAFDKHSLCHLLNYEDAKCDRLINQLSEKKIIQLCDYELYRILSDNPDFNNWRSTEQEMDACVADRYMLSYNTKT